MHLYVNYKILAWSDKIKQHLSANGQFYTQITLPKQMLNLKLWKNWNSYSFNSATLNSNFFGVFFSFQAQNNE